MPLVPYNGQVAKQHQMNTHHVWNLAETSLVDSIQFRGWMDAAWMIKNFPLKSLKAKFGPNNEATPQICRINLIHKIQKSDPHITHQQFPFTRHKESNLVSSTQLTHEFLVNSTSLQWHGHCAQTVVQLLYDTDGGDPWVQGWKWWILNVSKTLQWYKDVEDVFKGLPHEHQGAETIQLFVHFRHRQHGALGRKHTTAEIHGKTQH